MSSPLFVFVGAKGGSGATTICAQTAKAIREKGNVALIDGDLFARRSMAIMLDAVRSLDASEAPIPSARIEGITIVELAKSYETAFTIDRNAVEKLAASLDSFKVVIVDAPQPLAAAVRPFTVRASRFLIVAEPNLLGMASAQSLLASLHQFGIPSNRLAVITNARSGLGNISRSEVERALGLRVVAELPLMNERAYGKSLVALTKYLLMVAAEPLLETLARPVEAPIGDRRMEFRRSSSTPDAAAVQRNGRPAADLTTSSKSRDSLKLAIHEALSKRIDLVQASQAHTDATKLKELRAKVEQATQSIISEHHEIDSAEDLAQLKQEIINESLGYGPLEDLLHDPDVTEVMVNGPNDIFIERSGRIEQTSKRFTGGAQLRLIIERILAPLGRRIDESSPMVDARLADGSRVNAIIEPLAIDGATLTIRRFGLHRLKSDDLLRMGAVNQPILDFLRAAIEARLNICVSGGTGSGKTTFLNILSQYLPDRERIITIEDAAELLLAKPHVVRLESRPANIEGHGEVRIRDLLRNALRMRPDRIIVGECRGAEALDMLQAMNTGHDGSLTTVHANSGRDALSRIETMVLMAGFDLPVRAIREQIASALDVVIQTSRLRDGSRKVTSISEVVGMEGEIVTMQELVRFAHHGVDKENTVIGEFQYTGVQPQCLRRFEEYGITYDPRSLSTLASASALW